MLKTAILGPVYTPDDPHHVAYLQDALVEINQTGKIIAVLTPNDADYQGHLRQAQADGRLNKLTPGQVLVPGFVDLHVHAPQWPQAGHALDKPLNEWLNDYTFPLEAKYEDLEFVQTVYHALVHTLLADGTSFSAPSTLRPTWSWPASAWIRAYGARSGGWRWIIPTYYRDRSSEEAIAETERFIQALELLGQDEPLAPLPVITPRFVPSCTDETLAGLGKLAQKYDLPIQSHVSESNWEHQYAIDRFGIHDAEVLDRFGLLTDKTVLAHGTQLTEADAKLLHERGTALAHCPISNAYFGNGVLPVKQLLAAGNEVGLGTDISGGYSPSLYDNIRHAVALSQVRTDGVTNADHGAPDSRISMPTAFYLATKGGAEALNLPVGAIEAGRQADLQILTDPHPWPSESPLERFERLMYQANRSTVAAVMVNGNWVYQVRD